MDNNQKVVTKAYVEMRRSNTREMLSDDYIPYYDRLVELLESSKAGAYFMPYSAARGLDEQAKLYAYGRTDTSKGVVTNAKPGDSPHNWGCATDWGEFRPEFVGQEVWNKANWEFYADCVRGAGLRWGGDFKSFKDKPHNELSINQSWRRIGDIFRKEGKLIAELAITNSKTGGLK